MKYVIILTMSFLLNTSLQAQTKLTEKEDPNLTSTKTDGFLMQDGKLMQMKDGLSVAVEEDIKLKNGTVVTKNGVVKIADGKTISLKNGDWIMKDGTIKHGEKKAGN